MNTTSQRISAQAERNELVLLKLF